LHAISSNENYQFTIPNTGQRMEEGSRRLDPDTRARIEQAVLEFFPSANFTAWG